VSIFQDTKNLFKKIKNTPSITKNRVHHLLEQHKTIIYGAGELGNKVMSGLHNEKKQFFIADNTKSKIGSMAFGTKIKALSSYNPSKKYLIIITIFSPKLRYQTIKEKIQKQFPNAIIIPFTYVLLYLNDAILPWYLFTSVNSTISNENSYMNLLRSLSDKESTTCLYNYLSLIMTGDSDLHRTISPENKLPFSLPNNTTYVDCGAYDGDTIEAYTDNYPEEIRHIIAFEPDPINFQNLKSSLSKKTTLSTTTLHNKAVCNDSGISYFYSTAGMGSKLTNDGNIKIKTVRLDSALPINKKTNYFIKMDIEGFEVEAIKGAQTLINKKHPLLAISVYHKPHDILFIYQKLYELGYNKFYCRAFGYSGADILLFAQRSS